MKRESLRVLIRTRIRKAKKKNVFLRNDFGNLGGYKQVGRALKQLTQEGILIKIGYGLYAKARKNSLTGRPMLAADNGFAGVSEEALNRLKVKWRPMPINDSTGTQVRTAAAVIVSDRFSRKIGTDKFQLRIANE